METVMDRHIINRRNKFIPCLSIMTDEELLERLYNCLRWINYFQDEDNKYIFMKIYQDVHEEVKRRKLKYTWTSADVKKFRIMGARMYYGALSYKELEWRLGTIILYSIPTYRNFVPGRLYLVRESIQIIIDCIHELGAWSELEYNRDVIATLDVPFFSYENYSRMFMIFKEFLLLGENILIFFLFVCETVLKTFNPILHIIDPEYGSWKNMLTVIIILVLVAFYVAELYE